MITRKTNIPAPTKKYPKRKFPEIIVPRTIIDNTYSPVLMNVSTKSCFSLSLNFTLVLFYDQLLKKSSSIKRKPRIPKRDRLFFLKGKADGRNERI